MEVKKTKTQTQRNKQSMNHATNATASLPVIICATNIAENVNVSDKSFILWNNRYNFHVQGSYFPIICHAGLILLPPA